MNTTRQQWSMAVWTNLQIIKLHQQKENKEKLLETEFDAFCTYIALWMEEMHPKERAEYVCALIASDNLWIKDEGIRLAERHKVIQALDLLEKERNNQMVPPRRFHDTGLITYTMSISLRARQAIVTLKEY